MRRITLLLLVAAAFQPVTAAQPAMSGVLTAEWSLPGRWSGVATDEKTGVIRALGDDRFAEIDVEGRIRRESRFPWNSEARLLRLATSPRVAFVTFTPWGGRRGVVGHGVRGERLWNYVVPDGPDDVWVGDVDGDAIDEVIIGYNGRGGVHVLDDQGRLQWTSASLANVWMVAAGDVLGLGTPQVVTTSARGKIHIFNGADGSGRQDISPPHLTRVVRVWKIRAGDATATIFAAGSNRGVSTAMALSGSGDSKWSVDFGDSVHTAAVAPSRPWLAFGTYEGDVHVIDAVRGQEIGLVSGQGYVEVGWAVDPPLLLVATGKALNAFRVGVD
jgi:hypothetical protein